MPCNATYHVHWTVAAEVALSVGCKSAAKSESRSAAHAVHPYSAEPLEEDVWWCRNLSGGSWAPDPA